MTEAVDIHSDFGEVTASKDLHELQAAHMALHAVVEKIAESINSHEQ